MVLVKYQLKNRAVAILYCSYAIQTGAKIENRIALLRRTPMDNNFLILPAAMYVSNDHRFVSTKCPVIPFWTSC